MTSSSSITARPVDGSTASGQTTSEVAERVVAGRTNVRVVSWNIEFGLEAERAASELVDFDELNRADIVFLQEMDRSGTEMIADALGVDHAFAAAATHPRTGREMGNAILSRWPMWNASEIELPHTARIAGQLRSATHAVVGVDGTSVASYSVHTETALLPFGKRREQYSGVAAHILSSDDATATVVGGDFNTVRRSERNALVAIMATAGLQSATQDDAPTFRRFGRDFALDHIFVRHLAPVDSGVVRRATASDHTPIWADLRL